jgi:hypothetical protein
MPLLYLASGDVAGRHLDFAKLAPPKRMIRR